MNNYFLNKMGVKKLREFFQPQDIEFDKYMKGKKVAIDVMGKLYAFKSVADPKKVDYIKDFLLNEARAYKRLFTPIYIFDSEFASSEKLNTIIKRNKIYTNIIDRHCKNHEKYNENLSKDEKIKLANENPNFVDYKPTSDEIKLAIRLLKEMDIKVIIADQCVEAEQICAKMQINGEVDEIISNDIDTFVYGAQRCVMKVKREYKLFIYGVFSEGIDKDLKYTDFVKIAVILGTDFNEKTKGIGIKRVYGKYKEIELTEEQQIAYNIFTKR